jgi:hypothetical protein
MEVKEELTVPQAASTFFPPSNLALSTATSITSSIPFPILGTHKVFPLLAIIWSKTFVQMLWAFLFFSFG